ncbi:MAG: hypothetical protein DMD40_03780 [Gemmatimonadetes bacterium]|nr:MAG: hypothetical protein DMD40_03780 [Gemmatimonadota bacterium]
MTTRVDPLSQSLTPDRVYYATGTMLGAEDFTAEQIYHRFQLARALAYLHGAGTVAGLRVVHEPAAGGQPERIRVRPGLAIDRLGRLVEVPRSWCIRLGEWYKSETADQLAAAFHEEVEIPVSDDSADPPAASPTTVDGVIADVFLQFTACTRGLTPAFQAGPYDALDAVAPSRVRDGFALTLVLRDDPNPLVPLPPTTDVAEIGNVEDRARAARKAVLNSWRNGTDPQASGRLTWEREHKRQGQDATDPAALFLARIVIPANPGPPVTRRDEPVAIDNYSRQFVRGTPTLALFLGL